MSEMITDIGIDLGTATVIVYVKGEGIVLKEPSVVAYDTRSGQVLCVGQEAYTMIGRTPDRIRAVKPLDQGVISDNDLCEKMLQHFLKKVYHNPLLKPRVALCVPSAITDVESRAVVDAAIRAGARKVYLIEEPVAAAIGAGVDIARPSGSMILDIGGGTANLALVREGKIVATGCMNVGGRLIKTGAAGKITYVSPVLSGLTDLRPGDYPLPGQLEAIAQLLTQVFKEIEGMPSFFPVQSRPDAFKRRPSGVEYGYMAVAVYG